GWEGLNLISTVGGFLSAVGVGMFMLDFLLHFAHGRRTRRNPWQAGSLEWMVAVPVPPYNFASIPQIQSRDPVWDAPEPTQRGTDGHGWLNDPDVRRRETLLTSALHARPEAVVVLPGNTWTPFVAAVFTSLFFAGFVAKAYWLSAIGAVLTLGALFFWA